MTLKRLLATGALSALLVVGVAGTAFATEEPTTDESTATTPADDSTATTGSDAGSEDITPISADEGEVTTQEGSGAAGHAEEECIEQLENGASIDDCQEAPNPLLPEWNEVIWGAIFFGVVLIGMMKFAVPAIRSGLKARETKIRGDIEGAEASRGEANELLAQYKAQLADAKSEADRLIEEARQAAESVRADLIARAEVDSAEVRARAQADLDQSVTRIKADLQAEVSRFAIELAERVVERNLDRDAQQALIERYISEVGGMGSSN